MDPAEIPLRDIHLPEAIGWWPLAPGWWIVLGLTVLAMAIAVFFWIRHKRRRLQRTALAELSAIEIRFRDHGDTHRLAQELSRLARRTALALDPDRSGAADTGAVWNDRLDTLNESGVTPELIKTALARAPYRPAEALDGDALLMAFRPWLAGLRISRGLNK